MFWAVYVLDLLLTHTRAAPPVNVNVVVIGDDDDGNLAMPFTYQKSLPAVNMAQEMLASTYRDQINFNFMYNITQCSGDGTGALAADLHCKYDIGVFIGPGCSSALKVISQLSKSWNIALISPVGSSITDKTLYPLVTTLSPYTTVNNAKGLNAILRHFHWSTVAVIYDTEHSVGNLLKEDFILEFSTNRTNVYNTFALTASTYTNDSLHRLWDSAILTARVFMIFCRQPETRALLLSAYDLGYATSGHYVYFIQETASQYPSSVLRTIDSSRDQDFLKSLGHALWPFVDKWRSENENFTTEVVQRSATDFNYFYNQSEVSPYVSCYYDAVMMFATVLNETLYEKGNPMNGTALTHKMWNRTFPGVNVPVRINQRGYRESDLTFAFYNMSTGVLTPALIWMYDTDTVDLEVSVTLPWPYNYGVRPVDVPVCGFSNEYCSSKRTAIFYIFFDGGHGHCGILKALSGTVTGVIAGFLGSVSLAGVLVTAFLFRAWKKQYEKDLWWWRIHSTELSSTSVSAESSFYFKSSLKSLACSTLTEVTSDSSNFSIWKGQLVRLRKLPVKYVHVTKMCLTELKMLRELNHTNILIVHGACLEDNLKVLVTEPCSKGSLEDLVGSTDVVLDTHFKFSLCTDVINGLCYIHDSPIKCHGRLTSEVCLIDNRFSVKLADYGLPTLYSGCQVDVTSQEYKHDCLWKAPEVLRSGSACLGSREADIYSFAIILQEVLTKDSPYSVESAFMTTDEIIHKVIVGGEQPFRPSIDLPNTMVAMKSLIESCWAEDPKQRPPSRSVKLSIKKIAISMGETGHLLDNLMKRMESYATNLEKMVDEKTRALKEEKKKSEELLDQILPRSVADCLKAGHRVEPQAYECVTIYFSDIVGFTILSGKSTPLEVVDLLNDLYSCFDSTIEAYDVYKVETIGDAYMVVSGLPHRNGNLHVMYIAKMAINVLANIREFKIRHLPDERLQIRIGLHSGPVCAGVVGLKMPRYCLFGDTVNVASRMESYGKAMRIHVSPSCKALLEHFGTFSTRPRGRITIKGKGEMFTYWLEPITTLDSKVIVNSEED